MDIMLFYRRCAVLMAVCIVVKVSCECQDNCNKCDESKECSMCLKGFYVENGRCKACSPLCLDCSNYGDCSECITGSWGSVCNETCLFVNNNLYKCKDKKCDRKTGQCAECEEGAFGVNCEQTCPNNCQKGICDIHGRCFQGCQQGFYGDTCNNTCPNTCVNSECFLSNGTCIQECPHNCKSCTSQTRCNVCKHGFYGYMCENSCTYCIDKCTLGECSVECKKGFYSDGESCKQCRPNCSSCTSFDECEKCLDGWYGPTCKRECDRISCSACEISSNRCTKCKPSYTLRNNICCPQNCLNCDRDARCLNCYDGFYGDTCQYSCMDNCKTCSSRDNCTECGLHFYDSKSELEAGLCMCDLRECEVFSNVKTCRQCKQPGWYTFKRGCCPCPKYCKDQSDCKPSNGNCRNGCQRGLFGIHCDKRCNIIRCVTCKNYETCQQCEKKYYGHACQYNCSLGCMQSSEGPLCNVETGHCVHGCQNGTWGKTCNQTCGKNCINGYCNSSTGHCLGCKSTHFGLFCEKEAESKLPAKISTILIIVVCIATCVVLCITVIAVVMITRKCFKRDNKDSIVNTGSVEMDETDATYPDTYQNITSCSRNRSVIRTTSQNTEMQTLPGTYEYVDVGNVFNAVNTYEALGKRDEHLYAESSYEALGAHEEHVYSKSSYEALGARKEHVYSEKSYEVHRACDELPHGTGEEPTYVNKT